jgi:RNA processing factor Prp31
VTRTIATAWFGTFLLDGPEILRSIRPPADAGALAERARLRREGRLTPEEEELLAERHDELWTTRDRRLATNGIRWASEAPGARSEWRDPLRLGALRESLLDAADRALDAAWDPSVHVQEAVRAAADLDRVRNLLGERLGSWISRDVPEVDPGDHARVVAAALDLSAPRKLGPNVAGLREARRAVAELYRSVEVARAGLEKAVVTSVPSRTPNLSALLGPELSARLLAQAGGLERLARLPASTIQVLGAEKAFFEHLRGRAPPPRHGLLFLHAALQSAGRTERGRLARALAGKVAIAARLDYAGAALNPSLVRSFEARRDALRARRGATARRGSKSRSRAPLHRATEHG